MILLKKSHDYKIFINQNYLDVERILKRSYLIRPRKDRILIPFLGGSMVSFNFNKSKLIEIMLSPLPPAGENDWDAYVKRMEINPSICKIGY